MKKIINYFTAFEIILYSASVIFIVVSFFAFGAGGVLSLIASIIGVTSLILNAKGNPAGQALMIGFSIIYAVISFKMRYFGEMITYLGMTAPMAAFALISWLKNPYNGNKAQVKINKLKWREIIFMALLSAAVTLIFYFILDYFNTANMLFSTLSITTSFIAAYLTMRRSSYFALAYAANDIVLIVLWVTASFKSREYVAVTVCFIVFLVNDLYGFVNWKRMHKNQSFKA